MSDTASRLEEVRKLLRQLDTPIRQVVIEARIVIASDKFSKQLGVRFGAQTGFTFNKYAAGQGGSLNTQPVVHLQGDKIVRDTRTQTPFELASGLASAGYSDSPQLNVNLPVVNPAGQLALTLINLGSGNLINLELSALEADTRGKVISSPRVVTADNQKAHIEQGTEIPYVTPGSANNPATVSFKKAVLRLEVTPQITPDNMIIMTVEVRKDNVGQFVDLGGGFRVPSIDTRNVTTQIRINNGDTAVIGGIFEETITNDVDQGAGAGRHPVLGLPVQDDGAQFREAGAPDLPHAARRQGIAQRGEVTRRSGSKRRSLGAIGHRRAIPACAGIQCLVPPGSRLVNSLTMLRCNFIAATSSSWDFRAPANRRSAARSREGSGLSFVDADAELERRLGVTIPMIFEIEGEAIFRDREEATLAELVARTGIVLATGGGVVIRPINRERLKANGTVLYLHADPATLRERTRRSRHRPLLNAADPLARLMDLYAQRDALYREVADRVIDSDRERVIDFALELEAARASVRPQ